MTLNNHSVHFDLMALVCGIIYLLMIPSIFIFLPIYMYANLNDVSWGTRSSSQSKNTTDGFFSSLKNLRFSGLCDVWNYILHGPEEKIDSGSENPACDETDTSDSDLTDSSDANMTQCKLSEDQDTKYSQYAVFGGVTVGNLRSEKRLFLNVLKRKERRRRQSVPSEVLTETLQSPSNFKRRKSMLSNYLSNQECSESEQLIMNYGLRKLKKLTKPIKKVTVPIAGLQSNDNGMIYSWIPKLSLGLYSNLAITPYDLEHREIDNNDSDLYSWITDDTSAISEVVFYNFVVKFLPIFFLGIKSLSLASSRI